MFENVLVGVDGRPGGRDAVALATELLANTGKLTIGHVRQGELNPIHACTPKLLSQEHVASRELLERERSHAGVEAELVSLVGLSPGRALHEQAESQHADLLVVGSCSRGVLGRVMVGDDTRAALNGAPCAIAIAVHGLADRQRIARIGVAYNGSPESEAALAAARTLAAERGIPVQALHILTIPAYGVGLFAMPIVDLSDERLEDADRQLKELRDVQARAIYGVIPGEELAIFGEDLDLLVVGSRSYGALKRLVLGSTSGYLERHARCSLLILPRAAAHGIEDEQTSSAAQPAAI